MRKDRLPTAFNANDVRKLEQQTETGSLISASSDPIVQDAHHKGKGRGAMHMPDKSAPHIHPDVRIEDKRPESCTKKREAVQGKVGQEVFGAEIYSSNHKAVAEAQKARQLQHSVGSGDILAMYDKAGR